jgi:RNA polymerase sigma-54 factor
MKAGLHQTAGLRAEMKINPRLYQAMDLLYMPLLDLQQHLKQELLNNPFLELVEPDEEEDEAETEGETSAENEAENPPEQAEQEKQEKDEIDWEEILLDGFQAEGGQREEHEEKEYFEPVTVDRRDLGDHLRDQITLLDLTPRQLVLAEEFVGNINEDGYLGCPLEELLTGINELVAQAAESSDFEGHEDVPLFTTDEAEDMLGIVQSLDPAGVGARDLRECLLLQLRDQKREQALSHRIVGECFDELVNHRWTEIAKRFGITPIEVQTAADEVAKLDPKPGLRYSAEGDNYITPDLVVEKIDGKYVVFLNDSNLPRLKLSRAYQEIARDKKKFDGENKEFISSKLNSANWMIQAIEQRRQTMLKVMNYIVERQREFFEKGVQSLRPLTLREVAEVVSMHESTVSRVTNEKFVQTPRGVLPLKFFFSSGLSTTDAEDVSARAIKAQIARLVQDEDSKDPLTDQAIVEILKQSGIRIARRTVAKYRDQLGVLSARMRRRV